MPNIDLSSFLPQMVYLIAATLLSGLIGLERQVHHKPTGVRTHALVGLGSCLFTLTSAYGFADIPTIGPHDPARVAAQVASGIGFLGAGLIFVNRDIVRGLTTAATVWVSAALGVACGAGLLPLSALVVVLHFVLIFGTPPLIGLLPKPDTNKIVRILYRDSHGVMRSILLCAAEMHFEAAVLTTHKVQGVDWVGQSVDIRFTGDLPLEHLVAQLSELKGVSDVEILEVQHSDID
ncbi:MAG: MgtC/SapB family protein [Actinomycetaceae bacterium]|nr:MgtC/SapB family protein [Actinomycetaceae bacterium]